MSATNSQEHGAKLDLKSVHMEYSHQGVPVKAIEELSFSVARDEMVCILGPSGCGKSTILHLIAGFMEPTRGQVMLDGKPVRGPGPDRAVVFQRHSLFPWKTVHGNIAFGPRMKRMPAARRNEIVRTYLEAMGLAGFGASYPHQLSVGMQQRAGLARAYANEPDVLLMDEPFASLDAQAALRMQGLLLSILSKEPKTVVFITHDIQEALFLADRVLLLTSHPGRLREEIPVPFARPRTQDVLLEPDFRHLQARLMDLVMEDDT